MLCLVTISARWRSLALVRFNINTQYIKDVISNALLETSGCCSRLPLPGRLLGDSGGLCSLLEAARQAFRASDGVLPGRHLEAAGGWASVKRLLGRLLGMLLKWCRSGDSQVSRICQSGSVWNKNEIIPLSMCMQINASAKIPSSLRHPTGGPQSEHTLCNPKAKGVLRARTSSTRSGRGASRQLGLPEAPRCERDQRRFVG